MVVVIEWQVVIDDTFYEMGPDQGFRERAGTNTKHAYTFPIHYYRQIFAKIGTHDKLALFSPFFLGQNRDSSY